VEQDSGIVFPSKRSSILLAGCRFPSARHGNTGREFFHLGVHVSELFTGVRVKVRMRTSPYRVSQKFALIEFSGIRVRKASYFCLYKP
jgi:hypothetical protein